MRQRCSRWEHRICSEVRQRCMALLCSCDGPARLGVVMGAGLRPQAWCAVRWRAGPWLSGCGGSARISDLRGMNPPLYCLSYTAETWPVTRPAALPARVKPDVCRRRHPGNGNAPGSLTPACWLRSEAPCWLMSWARFVPPASDLDPTIWAGQAPYRVTLGNDEARAWRASEWLRCLGLPPRAAGIDSPGLNPP
jgi:hypothetical protein